MNLFGVLNISESALVAERERAEVVTTNLANADTTRTPQGGPYRRMEVVFSTEQMGGQGGNRRAPRLVSFQSRQSRIRPQASRQFATGHLRNTT